MKKILITLTIVLLLPFAPRAQAATAVSLNLFYDNLAPEGNWIDVNDYGYCFQPNVAVNDPSWRPYADGYWAYTDDGWTWVSYEDFGWATYHYGRWARLTDYGWVWVPGYEWAPAWVSWRTGGDYVGWAPLPPAADRVYEGRAITGHVDVEFDIGPQYYNFVDVRYIGEPVLRQRIIEPQRNVTIINRTVNVTNITYRNSTVYNYGPDYNRLNEYSTRPIQRLSIQRESNIGGSLTAQGGARRNFNRVNGNRLMVVAPQIQKSKEQIAPKKVKAKVQQPKFEHGWQGVSNREQLQAQMKKENRKNIPPPNFQPRKGRAGKTAAAPENRAATQPNKKPANPAAPVAKANAANAGKAANKQENGKRKGEKNNRAEARQPQRGLGPQERKEQAPNVQAQKKEQSARQRNKQAKKEEQQGSQRAAARRQNEKKKAQQKDRAKTRAGQKNRQQAERQRRQAQETKAAEKVRPTAKANDNRPQTRKIEARHPAAHAARPLLKNPRVKPARQAVLQKKRVEKKEARAAKHPQQKQEKNNQPPNAKKKKKAKPNQP